MLSECRGGKPQRTPEGTRSHTGFQSAMETKFWKTQLDAPGNGYWALGSLEWNSERLFNLSKSGRGSKVYSRHCQRTRFAIPSLCWPSDRLIHPPHHNADLGETQPVLVYFKVFTVRRPDLYFVFKRVSCCWQRLHKLRGHSYQTLWDSL